MNDTHLTIRRIKREANDVVGLVLVPAILEGVCVGRGVRLLQRQDVLGGPAH